MTLRRISTLKRLLDLAEAPEPMSAADARAVDGACRDILREYEKRLVQTGRVPPPADALRRLARRALLHLGADPDRPAFSLRHYDAARNGPFLGVSDEGSAAPAICEAFAASPKARALGRRADPLALGGAVDAERLAAVGEVAVGPEEYADVWLATAGRALVTTNVGTRANVRVYRRSPRVTLTGLDRDGLAAARGALVEAFLPFLRTPDMRPRPVAVHLEFARKLRATPAAKLRALRGLVRFVRRSRAARAPLHRLGLVARVGWEDKGRAAALRAIDLVADAGLDELVIDGVVRKDADEATGYPGLLNYLRPADVRAILTHAQRRRVRVRPANVPDPDTIARSVWTSLVTARNLGVHLGKFGTVPLALRDTERVVSQVERWLGAWSAAPVFFVDYGLLTEQSVHVERDLMKGLKRWLASVRRCGARVVLIDTIDKGKASRLVRSAQNPKGYLTLAQIAKIDRLGRQLGVHILWAGGLGLREAYELGRLGVFGIYVTSAASSTVAVRGSYRREPTLPAMKEPSRDLVLRVKTLLEAGFLAPRVSARAGAAMETAAHALLDAVARDDARETVRAERDLAERDLAARALRGWRAHWRAGEGHRESGRG